VAAIAKVTPQALATSFDEEKRLWDKIKDSRNADDFYAFLQKYPNGTVSETVLARLNQINSPTLQVQSIGVSGIGKPYTRATYKLGDEFESAYESGGLRIMQRVTSVSPNEVAVTTAVILNGKEQPGASIELFDPSGGSRGIKGMFSYNPPQHYFPAEQMQVGMRWKLGYEAVASLFCSVPSHTINGEARVVSQEALKTEAGTLNAFKVEMVTYQFCQSRRAFALPVLAESGGASSRTHGLHIAG